MARTSLDKEYFYGPTTIAQISEASVTRNLQTFITLYEETYLRRLLGDALYEAYDAGMNEVTPEAKWVSLDGQLFKVTGTAPNQIKLSPAANFVYWFYQRNNATTSTGNGEKIPSAENMKDVGYAPKAKLVWNAMAKRGAEIRAWVKARPDDYPQYVEPVYDASTPEALAAYRDRVDIVKTVIPFF